MRLLKHLRLNYSVISLAVVLGSKNVVDINPTNEAVAEVDAVEAATPIMKILKLAKKVMVKLIQGDLVVATKAEVDIKEEDTDLINTRLIKMQTKNKTIRHQFMVELSNLTKRRRRILQVMCAFLIL
jgi:hypothetical protein